VRNPYDVAAYAEREAGHLIPSPELEGKIELWEYDPAWPDMYQTEQDRLRDVLGDRVVRVEHAGSTSVPGLAAKPIIDMVLEVRDSAAEAAYVPDLEAAGYRLRIREPEWLEHRLFNGPASRINLHVFSADCTETDRMVRFRDWLRSHPEDRQLYESVKRDLSQRDWKYVQQYADAKTAVVSQIMERADAVG
jgi:GrpB-like predicted nucleotidyltransferase (UPF0157 family)